LAIVDHIFALLHRKITIKSIRERAMLIKNWQAVLLVAPMQLQYLSPFPLYMEVFVCSKGNVLSCRKYKGVISHRHLRAAKATHKQVTIDP